MTLQKIPVGVKFPLYEGVKLINAAIEEAEKSREESSSALTISNQANETANAAEQKADSVQSQFNQVVIEGDSSVESAQARVAADGTTYTTLQERLNQSDAHLAENAQDISDQTFSIGLGKYLRQYNNIFEDALEAAINALPTSGGEISFPIGYQAVMTRTVTITKNNVVLAFPTIYYANNISTNTLNLTMFKILAYGFKCKNVNIIGDGTDEYGAGATTIPFEVGDGINHNLDNFTLVNCSFTKCKKINLKTRNFIIENNLFSWMDTCLEINGVDSTSQSDRRNYQIQHNRFHVSNVGIDFAGTVAHSEVHCADNAFDRNNYDIRGCVDDSNIIDNIITVSKADAINISGSGKTVNNQGNNISGNMITSWVGTGKIDGYGIYTDIPNSKINDNTVKRKGKDGICVKGSNSQINDNFVRDSDFSGQSLYSGIRVGANNCQVSGNTSIRTDTANSTQQYGVFIESTSQGTQLGQNTFSGALGQMNTPPSTTIGFIGEGISRAMKFGAAIPSNTDGQRGDIVYNKIPTETGSAGSRYIVYGWQKVQDYTGASSWVELRGLTGR